MQGESFRLNVNTHSGHALKVFTLEPESVFTIKQIRCSRSSGMGVHVGPEYARVKSDFEIDGKVKKMAVRGSINGGGPKLTLKTSGGSIKIKEI